MIIREATNEDVPGIVALLKMSLGESLMPKSAQYWCWKHINNPFGRSPVLVCEENAELVGVRAFMRWEWTVGGNVYKAVRAVDTATHPDYQGKGIFKKLTLALVDFCQKSGDHFVFNTPNAQSKPGYLKMGWREAGRLPIAMSMQRPFNMLFNLIRRRNSEIFKDESVRDYANHPGLDALIRGHNKRSDDMVTCASADYFKWRYLEVPVSKYLAIAEESGSELNGILIVRIKESRLGNELRVTDIFVKDRATKMKLMKKLNENRKQWDVDFTTVSGTSQMSKELKGINFSASIGPSVTIRSLSMTDLSSLVNFSKWSPSLGDLELF